MKTRTQISIISAAAALGMAVLTLSYAGYAWFTMGRSVRAEGINLSATAPNDLEISLNGVDGWAETVTVNTADIVKKLNPEFNPAVNSYYLLPSSSYAGFNDSVFYTKRARSDGSAYPNTVFLDGLPIHRTTETYEGCYIDVPLYFRTRSDVAGGFDLGLDFETTETKQGTTITSPGTNLYKIARAAFINPAGTANSLGGTEALVLASPERGIVTGVITSSVTPGGAPRLPDYLSITNNMTPAVAHVDPAIYVGGEPQFQVTQIVVRLWIEGQDSNCLVTVGGKTFNMGLTFTKIA